MSFLGGILGFANQTISEIESYLTSEVSKQTGIVKYTRSNMFSKYGDEKGNLCNANLSRNFFGGNMLLESPEDIDGNSNFYIYNDTSTDPKILRKSYFIRERVGDLFGLGPIDSYSNTTKKLITVDGFTIFETAIRNSKIYLHRNFYTDNIVPEKINSADCLSEVELYDGLKNYNSSLYLNLSDKINSGNLVEYYNKLTIKSDGGDDYSYRGKIRKDLEKRGLLNTILNSWKIYKPLKEDENVEYYSIESPWREDSFIKVKIFDGGLSSQNEETGKRNYTFYQEADSEDKRPTTLKSDGIGSTEDIMNQGLTGKESTSMMIKRTNSLFYEMKTKTLINRFHTNLKDDDFKNDELVSSFSKYGLSRGRNLLTEEAEEGDAGVSINNYDNPYCRVWTAHHQYNKLSRRIRPFYNGTDVQSISDTQSSYGSSLRPNGPGHLENYTVLTKQGFVRMTPTHDKPRTGKNVKNYMFSIENLAWRDCNSSLTPEQMGDNGGRIMWFPPYNLKFTENVNVDWNANKFIGRGEQIYTYTNTDRSGTLSFTLLIDHPIVLDKYVGNNQVDPKKIENNILRFFAGCGDLEGSSDGGEDKEPEKKPKPKSKEPELKRHVKKIAICCFFPNNWSGSNFKDNPLDGLAKLKENPGYENTLTTVPFGIDGTDIDEGAAGIVFTNHDNNYSKYFLNSFNSGTTVTDNEGATYNTYDQVKEKLFASEDDDFEFYSLFDPDKGVENLNQIITSRSAFGYGNESGGTNDFRIDSIDIYGSASSHGKETDPNGNKNKRLSDNRGTFLKNVCKASCPFITEDKFNKNVISVTTEVTDVGERNINSIEAKIARSAYLVFNISWSENAKPSNTALEGGSVSVNDDPTLGSFIESGTSEINNIISSTREDNDGEYSYDNEYKYFKEVRGDEMVYKYIAEKVKYFDPAFHSITPEGFNARLTFLHQCTRQGPTMDLSSGNIDGKSNSTLKYGGNIAFGRPPYCILRIGDFYHTKICITSMSINYDTGNGIQWDMNQEGVGVQPMFANIDINFNFIGGQDLAGPIERLQNAVTANYYANASVYDWKADEKGKKVFKA